MAQTAAYGTWESPITPSILSGDSVDLEGIQVNEKDGKIYLLERRPHEGGRSAIVEYHKGNVRDVLPERFSASSQVHEYGGASFLVRADGRIIFTDFKTKGVYILDPATQEYNQIGLTDPKVYFADFAVNGRWVVCVKEDHHEPKSEDVKTSLVAIKSERITTLVEGADFYSYPRFSPDGKKFCWISWNHPEMPWSKTELWVGDFTDGQVTNAKCVAGKDTSSAVNQPVWGNDNSLFYVDDHTGYCQLYQWNGTESRHIKLDSLEDADFCCPNWFLGCQWYTPLKDNDTLLAFCNKDGAHNALIINTKDNTYQPTNSPINEVFFNSVKRVSATQVAVIGATATSPSAFFLLDLTKPRFPKTLKSTLDIDFPPTYFSKATNIKFPRTYSPADSKISHAYGVFLPPNNPEYTAPPGTLPPLIVLVHGGPTGQVGQGVSLRDQFWTTRGYAVAQVNYVGSSGHGREYRRALDGQWGVADIADAASCVEYLVRQGHVDGKRVGIMGGSAGGYLVMLALCVYPGLWRCGVTVSGISNLQSLVAETHKFESHYMEPLLFPSGTGTTAAERDAIIHDRSPITHAAKITAPLLLLAGELDKVVPPNQAQMMSDKIRGGGGTAELVVYPGEGHGFHMATSLEDMGFRQERWFRKYLVGDGEV